MQRFTLHNTKHSYDILRITHDTSHMTHDTLNNKHQISIIKYQTSKIKHQIIQSSTECQRCFWDVSSVSLACLICLSLITFMTLSKYFSCNFLVPCTFLLLSQSFQGTFFKKICFLFLYFSGTISVVVQNYLRFFLVLHVLHILHVLYESFPIHLGNFKVLFKYLSCTFRLHSSYLSFRSLLLSQFFHVSFCYVFNIFHVICNLHIKSKKCWGKPEIVCRKSKRNWTLRSSWNGLFTTLSVCCLLPCNFHGISPLDRFVLLVPMSVSCVLCHPAPQGATSRGFNITAVLNNIALKK